MKECKECELAIYCYTDSSTWIFRTKEEMKEKREAMLNCSIHQRAQRIGIEATQKSPEAPTRGNL